MAFTTGRRGNHLTKEEMIVQITHTLQGWDPDNVATLYEATNKPGIQNKVQKLKPFL